MSRIDQLTKELEEELDSLVWRMDWYDITRNLDEVSLYIALMQYNKKKEDY